ncbi:hypothetical protein C8R43DRAFT_1124629 [Mycena crocata]|nr:hypothetical protein C8R43DRAFT_1124629 [Mycena crocata]
MYGTFPSLSTHAHAPPSSFSFSSLPQSTPASTGRWALVLLFEIIASALTSFAVLEGLLHIIGLHVALFTVLRVTFGFTILIFSLLETATAVWHRRKRSMPDLDRKSGLEGQRLKDVEAGATGRYQAPTCSSYSFIWDISVSFSRVLLCLTPWIS